MPGDEMHTVDVERGSALEGVELTDFQKMQLYTDGFVVLKGVIDKELTTAAKGLLFGGEVEGELHPGRGDVGARPEITDLINKSRFTPMLTSLIGEFDAPVGTHVGVLPVSSPEERKHSILPFYNAYIHMDGLTTTMGQNGNPDLPFSSLFGNQGPEDLELFQKHYMHYISRATNGNDGRHAPQGATDRGFRGLT